MHLTTLWAFNFGTTLIIAFFYDAIFADGFDERANVEEAHEHLIFTRAAQARLARPNLLALFIVFPLIVTSCNVHM